MKARRGELLVVKVMLPNGDIKSIIDTWLCME
jgi:hypothetical protein